MQSRNPQNLIRPTVRALHPYTPGEQPKIPGLIKLNTNENPYPPSPRVLAAVKSATDDRLRLYPNPTAESLRAKLAKLHRCRPQNIIVGNGSDELLAMAVRAFVEPVRVQSPKSKDQSRLQVRGSKSKVGAESMVQYFVPSYSLYPVLADIHGAAKNAVSLALDFSIPAPAELKRGGMWNFQAALTFVTTPNAPGGRGYKTSELDALCRAQRGIVVLDEAYVDFADQDAMRLALKHRHVLVSRTFSKAYSLCFQRVGYFVGHATLIEALQKIRDSYNVNGLGQVAAEATLADPGYYRRKFREIKATRETLSRELTLLGFRVCPSQTNFIFVRPPLHSAERWFRKLRDRRILVRWFEQPEVRDSLRITIGTRSQGRALVAAVKQLLAEA